MLGDGNDDLRIVLGYDQLAELVRNQVVAFARTLIERVRELVVALADIRLRASDVASHALAIEEANAHAKRSGGDGVIGKRLAVIHLVRAGRSQRDRTLFNRDIFRARSVLTSSVVGARGAQQHLLGAEMRQANLGRVKSPRFAIDAVFNIELIAVFIGRTSGEGRKRLAVIHLLHVLLSPSDGVCVNLAAPNLEPAIFNHERHVREVRARIGELTLIEAHLVGTDIRTLGNSSASEDEVSSPIQTIGSFEAVIAHCLLGAIVGLGHSVALDGHGHLIADRSHLKNTVLRVVKRIVAGLGALVQRVGERILNGARIRDCARIGIRRAFALGKAGHRFHLMLGVLVAIIDPFARSRLHMHRSLLNYQRAALGGHGELIRHVVVRGVNDFGRARDGVGVRARIGFCHARAEARHGVFVAVNRELEGLEALGHMLVAVVGELGGVRLNLDLVLRVAIGNGQRAFGLRNGIVVGLGALVQRVVERVGRRSDDGLGTRKLVRCTLALSEARLGLERIVSVLERGTVVLLVQIGGFKGHLCFVDLNKAVGYLKGHVFEIGRIGVGELVLKTHGGRTGIGAMSLRFAREVHFVLRVQLIIRSEGIALGRMLFTVIGCLLVVTNNSNNNGRGNGIDRQVALELSNLVISRLRALVQGVRERILARPSVRLRTSNVKARALALGEAVTRHLHIGLLVFRKRSSVIALLGRIGCQNNLSRGNGQRAVVFNHKRHVREVRARIGELVGFEAHLVGTDVRALGNSSASEIEVIGGIQAIGACNGIARHGLLGSIVFQGCGVTCNGNGHFIANRSYLEVARSLRYVVIIGVRSVGENVAIDVTLALTHVQLGASKGSALDALILHESLGYKFARLKIGAVVGLGRVFGRNSSLGFIDYQRTALGGHGELGGHIVARSVSNLGSAGNVVGIDARIGFCHARAEARHGVFVAVNRELEGLEALGHMLVAVVGELGGISLHRNLVLLTVSAVGNGQRPLRCSDVVIGGVGTLGIAPLRNRAFA